MVNEIIIIITECEINCVFRFRSICLTTKEGLWTSLYSTYIWMRSMFVLNFLSLDSIVLLRWKIWKKWRRFFRRMVSFQWMRRGFLSSRHTGLKMFWHVIQKKAKNWSNSHWCTLDKNVKFCLVLLRLNFTGCGLLFHFQKSVFYAVIWEKQEPDPNFPPACRNGAFVLRVLKKP